MNTGKTCLAALLAMAFVGSSQAIAQSYSFTVLRGVDGIAAWATGINNAGQVVGYSYTSSGNLGNLPPGTNVTAQATLWNGATPTALSTPGGYSIAWAINSAGQVAGFSATTNTSYPVFATLWNGTTPTSLTTTAGMVKGINDEGQAVGYSVAVGDNNAHATLWNGTTPTALNPLGSGYATATAINNGGQAVGASTTDSTNSISHAVIWNATTTAIDLGTLGGNYVNSYASGINASGAVVGFSKIADAGGEAATIWNGAAPTALAAVAGYAYSFANAINDAGQVVGSSYGNPASGPAQVATLWDGVTVINLNTVLSASTISSGWIVNVATGINHEGQIVGSTYNTLTGEVGAFILAPVPEPKTYGMMLAGLGLIGFLTRRRKNS